MELNGIQWTDIFVRSCRNRNPDSILRILKDALFYLRNVPKNERESVLENILLKNKGILNFIDIVIKMDESEMEKFHVPLQTSFSVLQSIMEQFTEFYKPYVIPTRNVCCLCLKSCRYFDIQVAACQTLRKSIMLFDNYDLQFPEVLLVDKSTIYFIIGTIIKYYPKNLTEKYDLNTIFSRLVCDLKTESSKSQRQQQIKCLKMYLQCVSDLIINFLPQNERNVNNQFEKLYTVFVLLCETNTCEEILILVTDILIVHIQYFLLFIIKDYNKWHNFFLCKIRTGCTNSWKNGLITLYEIISAHLLQEQKEDMFWYFMNFFKSNLNDTRLTCSEISSTIYGLGQFSIVYKNYSIDKDEIIQIIIYQTLPFFSKEETIKNLELLPCCVQALSNVLNCIEKISPEHVNVLLKLSILILKKFPKFTEKDQIDAIKAIKITFRNVKNFEKKFQNKYFDSFFYEGIIWSCCNLLFIDVRLQQQVKKSTQLSICYKNYVPLWSELFKADNFLNEELCQQIFIKFVEIFISFIDKLNLNITSNKILYQTSIAENEEHYRYFINLVDLVIEIIEETGVNELLPSIEKLLMYLIRFSYEYPLVSGFSKLIRIIFIKLEFFYSYDNFLSSHCFNLLNKYLLDILKLIDQSSDELQLSYIYLILNSPLVFVENLIDKMDSVLKVALEIGLKNIPLAFFTLKTLEIWCNNVKSQHLSEFYENIVFHIEPYFTENVDMSNKDLEILHKQILVYYGSVNFYKLKSLVHESSSKINTKWDEKNLSFKFFFCNGHMEIYLNKLIVKAINNIESNNRKIKFSACELLHTFIIIILGKKFIKHSLNKNLCSVILKLGCDSDDAVRNLFHPLVIGLIHYLSTKLSTESISQDFLDLLFENLSDESNLILRDYSGICLQEFVQWTFKQSTEKNSPKTSYVGNLVNKIQSFALHPSKNKRLAAVIMFNYLYPTLENIRVINRHWLEFLHMFVKCLEHYRHEQIFAALKKVEEVIKVTANVLNAKSKDRRVSSEFSNETLKSAVSWLLDQCGSLNGECRHKCMKLFENLCLHVPGIKSVKEFIQTCGVERINNIALKNLDTDSKYITVNNAKAFLRSLDVYIWIMNRKFIPMKALLLTGNQRKYMTIFLKYFTKFVSTVVNKNIENILEEASSLTDSDELRDLINKIILKIFKFLLVLSAEDNGSSNILEKFWTNDLNHLISRFTFCPFEIGIIAKDFQFIKQHQLENWFETVLKKLSSEFRIKLQECLYSERKHESTNFLNIEDVIKSENILSYCYFLRGATVLQNLKVCDFIKKLKLKTTHIKTKINDILEKLKTKDTNGVTSVKYTLIDIYLLDLMNFLLVDYEPELAEFLINLISSNSTVNGSSHSDHNRALEILKIPTFKFLLINPSESLSQMKEALSGCPDKLFQLIEELLRFSRQNPSCKSQVLADEVIKRCAQYRTLASDVDSHKEQFFEVNRAAVIILNKNKVQTVSSDKVHRDLYNWIRDELNTAQDLERKMYVLESFFLYVSKGPYGNSPELGNVLRSLWDEDLETRRRLLEMNEVERIRAVQRLRCLMNLLTATKAQIVLLSIAVYVAGVGKYFVNEKLDECLARCFSGLSNEEASKMLVMLFKNFMDLKTSWEERLDVLRYVLLPSLNSCSGHVVAQFFKLQGCSLVDSFTGGPNDTDLTERRQNLVTQIGYYNLTELAVSKAEIEALDFEGLDVEKALFVVAKSEDERELTRQLNCAALNCVIASAVAKDDRDVYEIVFSAFKNNEHFLWEQIIDCERYYELRAMPSRFREHTLNMAKSIVDLDDALEPAFARYFRSYDPTKFPARSSKTTESRDHRMRISLEDDELNAHECMPSLTGLLMHLFNSQTLQLPYEHEQRQRLKNPDESFNWLASFYEALILDKDNVSLFIMRLFGNVKRVFLSHLGLLFEDLARALCSYLSRNSINYLVRDVLVMLLEAELALEKDTEIEAAQALLEALIERAPDPELSIYEYHLELIEALVKVWKGKLKIFRNFNVNIEQNEDLALRLSLVMFRHGVQCEQLIQLPALHALVRRKMYKFREPISHCTYEVLGWILRYVTEQQRDDFIKKDMIFLLRYMQRLEPDLQHESSQDVCVQNLYQAFRAYPDLAAREDLQSFMDPRAVCDDRRRSESLEMLLESMACSNDAIKIASILETIDLLTLLYDRVLACLTFALKIVDRLVDVFEATPLLPYLEAIEVYTGQGTLLVHRKAAYSTFMYAYEKHLCHEQSRTENSQKLLALCKRVLITGVTDPSDEIQDDVLNFWKERANLPDRLVCRLLSLTKMFSLDVSANFAQFVCALMLDLANEWPESRVKVLFPPLADPCYDEYEVATPKLRCGRNESAPLFAPSLTALLDRAVVMQGHDFRMTEWLQELPVTGFDTDLAILDRLTRMDTVLPTSKIPNPFENRLSKRSFSESSENLSLNDSNVNDTPTLLEDYNERLKQEIVNQNDNVKINRVYKTGNYPDVEITQSDVVVTMQDLARRDKFFARELAVLLICGITRNKKNNELNQEITSSIVEMCNSALETPNDFTPAALEILHCSGYTCFNAEKVAKISNSMNLQFSGILLLERSSICRAVPIYNNSESFIGQTLEHSLQLITMYQSIDESDVVKSILNNWWDPKKSISMRQGILAEIDGEYTTAKSIYQNSCEVDDPDEKYYLEGLYRCFEKMSSWEQLNKKTHDVLDTNDVNEIWNHPKRDDVLPWLVTGHLHKMLDDVATDRVPQMSFLNDFVERVNESRSLSSLLKTFGEELSVFHLCNEHPSTTKSRRYLRSSIDDAWKQWLCTNPLNREPRLQLLEKFGRAGDTEVHQDTLDSQDANAAADELIRYWDAKSPEIDGGRLVNWSTRIAYRVAFAYIFIKKIKDAEDSNSLLNTVIAAAVRQRLELIELAIKQGNVTIARKYALQTERTLENLLERNEDPQLTELYLQFNYTASKYKFACGKVENDLQKKFDYYIHSWQLADSVIKNEGTKVSMKIQMKYHTFEVTRTLHDMVYKNTEYLRFALNCYTLNEKFLNDTLEINKSCQLIEALRRYNYDLLSSSCKEGNLAEKAESCVKFAEYCQDRLLQVFNRTSSLRDDYVLAVLTAMQLGSVKAVRYFPNLLNYIFDQNDEQISQLFIDKCVEIPSWMFLYCQEQIIYFLNTSHAPLILPIIKRLAEDFPDAIIYSFREIYTIHPDLEKNHEINSVYKSLTNPKTEQFFNALEYLCQPEQYIKYYLSKLIQSTTSVKTFIKAFDSSFNKVLTDPNGHEKTLKGALFEQVLKKHCNKIEKLKTLSNFESIKINAKEIYTELDNSMLERLENNKVLDPSLLQNYSQYLSDFSYEDFDIEVPGQSKLVRPHYRITIARIDTFVEVINSKSRAVKISIIGTNGKTYKFLVKFGVDLRRDQRMQRFFESTNDILYLNSDCSNRHLQTFTHTIVPLSINLSLVQWINKTKSLLNIVQFTMNDKSILKTVATNYQNWIEQSVTENLQNPSYFYKQALLRYNPKMVETKMKELTDQISWDLLRKTFVKICPSVECFFKLRQNFIKNYAVMCAVHWIVGVGDRRPKNILVELTTGECFGVDFSMVFGTGHDQPIPELVPFRLTAQILGLMRPFRGDDLFGMTMSHVIGALRHEKNQILAHLNLLLREDLDWIQMTNRRWQDDDEKHKGVTWFPNSKYEIVQRKLNGDKPSDIMVHEISQKYINSGDNNNQYLKLYECIINGNEFGHNTVRSWTKNSDLTPMEQVQCLVDQATDINTLGRMWVEWCPFV